MSIFPGIFITGTDTGIGKTHISESMLLAAKYQGFSTLGMKPLASGAIEKEGRYYNEDAITLQKASTIVLPYTDINPFLFKEPIAPHIAAEKLNQLLSVKTLIEKTEKTLSVRADVKIIEGVGGWCVPLNAQETMADFAIACKFAIVFVVGIRLGCLNHAILTAKAFQTANVKPIFWVANLLEPASTIQDDNIKMLKQWLPYPYIGAAHFNQSAAPLFADFFRSTFIAR